MPNPKQPKKKIHKHKWYETTLMKGDKDRESVACKCGSWEVRYKN